MSKPRRVEVSGCRNNDRANAAHHWQSWVVVGQTRGISFRAKSLENVFEAELYESRRDGGTSNLAEARATDDCARIAELRVIERVEKLGAEFQRRSFVQSSNPGRFGEGHVEVRLVRPAERSSADIAVRRAIADLGKRAGGIGRVNGGAVEIAVQAILYAPTCRYLAYCEPRT